MVFHCFSGDAAMAVHCVRRGYVLSFAGTVTFKNAADAARRRSPVAPLDQLLVETDAPVPHADAVPRPAQRVVPDPAHACGRWRTCSVSTRTQLATAVAANTDAAFGTW